MNNTLTQPRDINVELVAKKLSAVDRAIDQWKRGEIQGVFITRTDSGHIAVKRMPRILED